MACQTKFFTFVTLCSNYRSLLVNRPLINYSQHATIRQAARDKLQSLPERPKKPMTPFFLFSQKRREELRKIHPNAKVTEIAKILSNEWTTTDAAVKQRYEIEYKNAMTDYQKKNLAYNAKLTEEQKDALKEVADEKAKEKQNRKVKKALKELNKPKRPKGPYIYFVLEYYGKDKIKYDSFTEFLKQSKIIWENLPEKEKEKFNDMYLDDKKRYELEMELWETKMISEGRLDLVRQQTLATTTKPTRVITKPPTNLTKEKSSKSDNSKSTTKSKRTYGNSE